MYSELKNNLIKAREYKNAGNYKQALEIYEKCYMKHPDEFKDIQKEDYAWVIYNSKLSNPKSEEEFFENVEFILKLIPQKDFNIYNSCVYTSTVFKVLNHYKDQENYPAMIPWFEKLDENLLDKKPYWKHGRLNRSHKEVYYSWMSKAYFDNFDYKKAIEVSLNALGDIDEFVDDGDIWLKRRIAKSYMELGEFKKALPYYLEVIEVKSEWYMYRDIAEIYYRIGRYYDAPDYLCPAVLSAESNKENVYHLCFKVFELYNKKMAVKHAQMVKILSLENGHQPPYDIERLDIDVENINRKELEDEIRKLWIQFKFKDQIKYHGSIISFNDEKNYGFIKSDDEEIFFHKNDFKEDNVFIGQKVSYFREKNFDKSKNKESVKAVIVRSD